MLAVAFLTTRVNVATREDREKLLRILKYLNTNRDLNVLKKVAPEVIPYIDETTGKLYCKLNKAVYGTIDAAKL
jgi:hypothetical protein